MENFIIGQYGNFDLSKQTREYKDSFWGVEACLMNSEQDVLCLNQHRIEKGVNIGIHFPLRSGQWEHRDPQYLSKCLDTRNQSYTYMENEFEYSKQIEPNYILMHYPKPVILDDNVDWIGWNWKFADQSEYYYESEYNFETFRKESEVFFKWFSYKANEGKFKPIIELDAIPTYIYKTNLLNELLEKNPTINICIDLGRLHLQHMIDENFDSFSFLESIVEYISEVHLWNIQVTDKLYNSHHPALPTLDIKDGWADIEKYFKILRKNERKFKILFEHQSDRISENELDECYKWISKLYKK